MNTHTQSPDPGVYEKEGGTHKETSPKLLCTLRGQSLSALGFYFCNSEWLRSSSLTLFLVGWFCNTFIMVILLFYVQKKFIPVESEVGTLHSSISGIECIFVNNLSTFILYVNLRNIF